MKNPLTVLEHMPYQIRRTVIAFFILLAIISCISLCTTALPAWLPTGLPISILAIILLVASDHSAEKMHHKYQPLEKNYLTICHPTGDHSHGNCSPKLFGSFWACPDEY
ncbi:MAG: hypothetical protein WC505_02475 [Patescibacteria group bacterium]